MKEASLGWIDPQVAEELPGLRLWQLAAEARDVPAPAHLKERLKLLSNRFGGAKAIAMRREPVPHAYRVLFRHLGIDPDDDRTPVEAAALARLQHGGFRSKGLVAVALLLAAAVAVVPAPGWRTWTSVRRATPTGRSSSRSPASRSPWR